MAEVPTVQGEGAALFRDMFGDALTDLVGLGGGDWIRECRRRRQDKLARDTEEILRARGVKVTPEAIQLPHLASILKDAQDESRSELQNLWARLLAAALDPGRVDKMRPEYIDVVKQMAPLDALVLQVLREPGGLAPNRRDYCASKYEVSHDEIEVTFRNLTRLDLIAMGGAGPSQINPSVTPYGREFLRLVMN